MFIFTLLLKNVCELSGRNYTINDASEDLSLDLIMFLNFNILYSSFRMMRRLPTSATVDATTDSGARHVSMSVQAVPMILVTAMGSAMPSVEPAIAMSEQTNHPTACTVRLDGSVQTVPWLKPRPYTMDCSIRSDGHISVAIL